MRQVSPEEYGRYLAQSRCTLRLLDQLLTNLKTSPGFEETMILVHADHGSRITLTEAAPREGSPDKWDEPANRGWVDAHSVLFAVKAPETNAGYDPAPAKLAELFSRYWLNEIKSH